MNTEKWELTIGEIKLILNIGIISSLLRSKIISFKTNSVMIRIIAAETSSILQNEKAPSYIYAQKTARCR